MVWDEVCLKAIDWDDSKEWTAQCAIHWKDYGLRWDKVVVILCHCSSSSVVKHDGRRQNSIIHHRGFSYWRPRGADKTLTNTNRLKSKTKNISRKLKRKERRPLYQLTSRYKMSRVEGLIYYSDKELNLTIIIIKRRLNSQLKCWSRRLCSSDLVLWYFDE